MATEEITTTVVLEAATLGSRFVLLHRRTDRRPVPAAERRPRLCSPRGEGVATAPRGLVTAVVGRSPSGARATRVGEREPSAGLSDAVWGRSSLFPSTNRRYRTGLCFIKFVCRGDNVQKLRQLLTVDPSARASMKNAANCDT